MESKLRLYLQILQENSRIYMSLYQWHLMSTILVVSGKLILQSGKQITLCNIALICSMTPIPKALCSWRWLKIAVFKCIISRQSNSHTLKDGHGLWNLWRLSNVLYTLTLFHKIYLKHSKQSAEGQSQEKCLFSWILLLYRQFWKIKMSIAIV